MPIGPARMPLFDHLGELRMRLVRIVVVLLIAVCVFYMATPTLSVILFAPISEFLPEGFQQGMYTTPFDAFATRFKLSFWASVVACSPVILWQILAFFLPALKPKERKWFIPTFAIAVFLFLFGTLFCYFIILDPAFQWLTDQAYGMSAQVLPQASSYLDIIINLVIFDIIPYKKMRGQWRTIYVVLMVLCAMITPDASPITMLLMFAALIVLYEVSLLLARIVLSKRIKKQNAELAAEEAEG